MLYFVGVGMATTTHTSSSLPFLCGSIVPTILCHIVQFSSLLGPLYGLDFPLEFFLELIVTIYASGKGSVPIATNHWLEKDFGTYSYESFVGGRQQFPSEENRSEHQQ